MASPTLEELELKYFPPLLNIVPHKGDTVVIPHVDGESYFTAVASALEQCSGQGDRVYIASWFFQPDIALRRVGGSETLSDRLIRLATNGADVRVIVATPYFMIGWPQTTNPASVDFWATLALGNAPRIPEIVRKNILAVRELRNAEPVGGQRVLESRILMDWAGRGDSRHEKTIITYSKAADELRAFVGGLDFVNDRWSDEFHVRNAEQLLTVAFWHDTALELRGRAAASVLANFRTRWAEAATLPKKRLMIGLTPEFFNLNIEPTPPTQPMPPPPIPTSAPPGGYLDSSIRILRSYEKSRSFHPWWNKKDLPWETLPSDGINEILPVLGQAIGKASRYIYIEDQGINPDSKQRVYSSYSLVFPLLAAACANNIKVILVTQGYAGPDSPVPALLTMSSEIRERILDRLTPDQRLNFVLCYIKDTKVHSKLVLVDDEFASVGSANLWDRSMTGIESELNATIVHTGGKYSLVADLRVRLWRGHLRVPKIPPSLADDAIDAELRDITKSLGLFRNTWGAGVTFAHPNSALREIMA